MGCPGILAASRACYVTDMWFTPHFSVLARFHISAWVADVACPIGGNRRREIPAVQSSRRDQCNGTGPF